MGTGKARWSRLYRLFCAIALVGASPVLAADEGGGFRLSGSVRLRWEAIDHQARAGFDRSDTLTSVRTQILAVYDARPLRFAVELYDSRAYGFDRGTPIGTGEINTLEPVQAYVAADLGEALGKGSALALTAGRFMLNLGSRRLVAADDYRNTTNGYTGLRADLSAPGGVKAVLIYTLPQQRLPDDRDDLRARKARFDRESFDAVLWGGVVSKARALGPATAEISYFHFGERDAPGRPTLDRSLDTFGGRIIAEPAPGRIDYEVEAFYQTGSISRSLAAGAPRQSVRADFVHVDVGYSFGDPWRTRLSVEFDRASGDRAGGRYARFDTLFGMRRADLAPAGLYNALARTNIVTPGVRLETVPDDRIDAFVSYRPMWLAAREDGFSGTGVRDPSGRSGRFAGHQIDGRLRWWLIPERLRYEVNGVLLFRGRFLRTAPNAPARGVTRYGSFALTASF